MLSAMNLHALAVVVVLAVASAFACGNSNSQPPPSCALACNTLASCNTSASGFPCGDPCNQGGCAQCINGSPCSAIRADSCAPYCPGVDFHVH